MEVYAEVLDEINENEGEIGEGEWEETEMADEGNPNPRNMRPSQYQAKKVIQQGKTNYNEEYAKAKRNSRRGIIVTEVPRPISRESSSIWDERENLHGLAPREQRRNPEKRGDV